MNTYQLAQLSCLLSLISSTRGSFQCPNDLLSNPDVLSSLIAVYACKARVASWYTSASLCPPELQAIFGWMALASGHSRRMCRILRSEWWQQVCFFRDCLRIACSREPQQPGSTTGFKAGQGHPSSSPSFYGTRYAPIFLRRKNGASRKAQYSSSATDQSRSNTDMFSSWAPSSVLSRR
ncbi:unnamed protein product [Ixodes hexagonus]